MCSHKESLRVLYSFPNKLGAGRICYTAWQQVSSVARAGGEVFAHPASVYKAVPLANVTTYPTLARGKFRLPYRFIGNWRAYLLHDWIVAKRLERLAGKVDIVHAWPLGALETLKTARRLGIPTVLERPNSHTRYAYEVVQTECDRLGVSLPRGYEHAFNANVLEREEQEYQLAEALLCPSEFVRTTFLDQGFDASKLVRHQYGYDSNVYYPAANQRETKSGLTMLFAGHCAVRKGLHFALEAWLASSACKEGRFLIAGDFLPAYAEKLASMLSHPSVHVLGHRQDVPELMRNSDILVLPSIEEGFGLVCVEAMGSGCVPLVSTVCTELCVHEKNALVHAVGDVDTLTRHITMLQKDRSVLAQLRTNSLATAQNATWSEAGTALVKAYRTVLQRQDSEAKWRGCITVS